jgi:hypothetical protein
MPYDEFMQRMSPYALPLVDWGLRAIADAIRDAGAVPVYAFIPMPLDQIDRTLHQQLLDAATRAGFAVIDLADVYSEGDPREHIVAEWERHPNAKGHRAIAQRLLGPLLSALGPKDGTFEAVTVSDGQPN